MLEVAARRILVLEVACTPLDPSNIAVGLSREISLFCSADGVCLQSPNGSLGSYPETKMLALVLRALLTLLSERVKHVKSSQTDAPPVQTPRQFGNHDIRRLNRGHIRGFPPRPRRSSTTRSLYHTRYTALPWCRRVQVQLVLSSTFLTVCETLQQQVLTGSMQQP